jgi:hypothetical protein
VKRQTGLALKILEFWTPVSPHCTVIPVQSNAEMVMCAQNGSNLNHTVCGKDRLNDEYPCVRENNM